MEHNIYGMCFAGVKSKKKKYGNKFEISSMSTSEMVSINSYMN